MNPEFTFDYLQEVFDLHIIHSKSVGKDGINVGLYSQNLTKNLELIVSKITDDKYNFTTYREKLISKGGNQFPRQISIPTIRDRVVLRTLHEILSTQYKFTRQRRPHVVVGGLKNSLKKVGKEFVFLRLDIQKFFPSIPHLELEQVLKKDTDADILNLVVKAIKTPTGHSKKGNAVGVPQGLSISNTLSSIYLNDFDVWVNKTLLKSTETYLRYVDDMLILCSKNRVNEIEAEIRKILTLKGMILHPHSSSGRKTTIKSVTEGVEYLGYSIAKNRVLVRNSSLRKMYDNISKVIARHKKHQNHSKLIFQINLKVTGCVCNNKRLGWVSFFSEITDLHQLKQLDMHLDERFKKITPGVSVIERKRFVKSYYEWKYKIDQTSYIPNFDTYDFAHKKGVVSLYKGELLSVVASWSPEKIELEFNRIIRIETSELEIDVDNFS